MNIGRLNTRLLGNVGKKGKAGLKSLRKTAVIVTAAAIFGFAGMGELPGLNNMMSIPGITGASWVNSIGLGRDGEAWATLITTCSFPDEQIQYNKEGPLHWRDVPGGDDITGLIAWSTNYIDGTDIYIGQACPLEPLKYNQMIEIISEVRNYTGREFRIVDTLEEATFVIWQGDNPYCKEPYQIPDDEFCSWFTDAPELIQNITLLNICGSFNGRNSVLIDRSNFVDTNGDVFREEFGEAAGNGGDQELIDAVWPESKFADDSGYPPAYTGNGYSTYPMGEFEAIDRELMNVHKIKEDLYNDFELIKSEVEQPHPDLWAGSPIDIYKREIIEVSKIIIPIGWNNLIIGINPATDSIEEALARVAYNSNLRRTGVVK